MMKHHTLPLTLVSLGLWLSGCPSQEVRVEPTPETAQSTKPTPVPAPLPSTPTHEAVTTSKPRQVVPSSAKSMGSEAQTRTSSSTQPSAKRAATQQGTELRLAPQQATRKAITATSKPAATIRRPQPAADQNIFYDKGAPSYAMLQKANEALAGFPVDREGQVHWMRALSQGLIKPRADLRGKIPIKVIDSDILMKNTRQMPYVRFPHKAHTQWLACRNCHEAIFVSRKTANTVTMTAIFQGEYCGVCHDKVAFSTFACERCHNTPIKGPKK